MSNFYLIIQPASLQHNHIPSNQLSADVLPQLNELKNPFFQGIFLIIKSWQIVDRILNRLRSLQISSFKKYASFNLQDFILTSLILLKLSEA